MSKRIEALLDNKALFLNSTLKEAQEEEKSRLSMLLSRNKQRINEIVIYKNKLKYITTNLNGWR